MQLYDNPGNPGTRRIRALANELDIRLDTVAVDLRSGDGQRPEYLKINPNGKIPSLVDGDFKLFETNAILCYLAAQSGKPSTLLPVAPRARAHVDQWLHWQSSHLNQAVMKIAFERIYKSRLNLGEPDQTRIDEGLKEFDRFCTVLDRWLATRDYVCDTLTVADFALAGTFSNRAAVELDLSSYQHLGRWLDRIEARPSWVHAG